MSDANNQHDIDGPHEGPVKTPKQLILAVLYAFVVPVVVIVLLVMAVTSKPRPAAGTQALTPVAVAKRIQPVAMVQVKDASDLTTLKAGDQVYAAQCAACHTVGLVGSPKLGDVAAWAPRIKTGYDALLKSALGGKGSMGPQGGGDFTDLEIGRAVVYMTNQAGAKFDEPAMPAAGASAPAATTAAPMPTPGAAPAPAPAPAPGPSTSPSAPAAAPAATAVPAPAAAATPVPAAAPVVMAAAPTAVVVAGTGAVPVLYTQLCQTCHTPGVAGAPKLGDKAAWTARLAEAKGLEGVIANATKGKGAMPAKGGSTASDAEFRAVVAFMVNSGK